MPCHLPLILAILASPAPAQSAAAAAAPTRAAKQSCPLPAAGALLWSQRTAWASGSVPEAGECVTIPASKTVVLDQSPPPLGGLDVDGTLVFACADLALTSDWIRVRGELRVGSIGHAFHRSATITLTDDFACSASIERNVLSVEGSGRLALHGEPRSPCWTRLDALARIGDSEVTVEQAPHWTAGDRIVIASTDFDAEQAEQRVLTSTSGRSLSLSLPLAFSHWGDRVAVGVDGIGVDERAEVALLSRRVVVQGTPEVDALGRTIAGRVVARNPTGAGPRVEVDWVEFRELGQEGVLGKYALHFDEVGDASGSHVRSSSIHHTYNRAIALRTTTDLVLEDNVAFDNVGHAFYVDDGLTRDVTWRRNLGMVTRAARPGYAVLWTDFEPATFWLVHPDNVVDDNVAAGSDAFGFWFEVADGEPDPPTSFDGNVAHSCANSGFYQDRRPAPVELARYSNLTAYKNRRYGLWLRSYADTRIENLRAADNRAAVYLASEGIQNDFVQTGGIAYAALVGGLIVGESNNVGAPATAAELAAGRSLPQLVANAAATHLPAWDALVGVEIYDGLLTLEDVAFAHFGHLDVPGVIERKGAALHQAQHNSPWSVDPRNRARNLTFVNANRLWYRSPLGVWNLNPTVGDNGIANTMLVDDDGSVTGIAGSIVMPDEPFLVPPTGASFAPAWNAWITAGAPAKPYAQLEFVNWSPPLSGQPGPMTMLLRSPGRNVEFELVQPIFGASQTPTDRYSTNAIVDELYEYEYDVATPVAQWAKIFSLSLQFTEPGRFVVASVPLPPISGGWAELDGAPLAPSPSIAAVQSSSTSAYFYDAQTGRAWLKVFTTGSGSTVEDGERATITIVSY